MNSAVAIAGITSRTVLELSAMGLGTLVLLRVADRLRLVNPAKAPAAEKAEAGEVREPGPVALRETA